MGEFLITHTPSPPPAPVSPPPLLSLPVVQSIAGQLLRAWNMHCASCGAQTNVLTFLPFSVDGYDIFKQPGSHYSFQTISASQRHRTSIPLNGVANTLSADLLGKLTTLVSTPTLCAAEQQQPPPLPPPWLFPSQLHVTPPESVAVTTPPSTGDHVYVFGPLPEIDACSRDDLDVQLTCLVLVEHRRV